LRRTIYVLAAALLALLAFAVPSCNIDGQPCGLVNVSACAPSSGNAQGGGGTVCLQGWGSGGDNGAGGAHDGAGGDSTGGDASGQGGAVGTDTGTGTGAGTGTGTGTDTGTNTGQARRPAGRRSRRDRTQWKGEREPVGQVQEADCDGPVETGLKVFCSQLDWGATCSKMCFAKGIPCVAGAMHPYKPSGGIGKLFSCNDLLVGFMCGYHYANGDDCYYPMGTPFPEVCAYSGNN
jgi:hypothetical protein